MSVTEQIEQVEGKIHNSSGRTTIPKEVRERLRISPGSGIIYKVSDSNVWVMNRGKKMRQRLSNREYVESKLYNEKGGSTIPQEVREKLEVGEGDKLVFVMNDTDILLMGQWEFSEKVLKQGIDW